MSVFLRTSRRTGVLMPWPLALIVGCCALVIWLAIVFYGLIVMALMFVGRTGMRAWRRVQRPAAGEAPGER